MINLTESELDLVYLLVDNELENVNTGWGLGSKGYAERLDTILNKLLEGKE